MASPRDASPYDKESVPQDGHQTDGQQTGRHLTDERAAIEHGEQEWDVHPSALVDAFDGPVELASAEWITEEAEESGGSPESANVLVVPASDYDSMALARSPETNQRPKRARWRRAITGGIHYLIVAPARLFCLVLLLGVLSVVPVLQLAVLGYFLDSSGRIARGGRFRDSLTLLPQAAGIGMAAAAVYLWTLPIQLLGYYAYAAELIQPGNPQAFRLRTGALVLVAIAFLHLSWAWARGGKLRHYLWPAPVTFATTVWRSSFWASVAESFWNFLNSLQLPRLLWIGLRGALGSLAWIILPAIILIAATRQGQTGLAGLVGAIGMMMMGFVVMYLPMLQVQFATDNRIRSMFAWRRVRGVFRSAPIAFWLGTTATLLLAVPLYLLKIEATPKEIVWLTSTIFVVFMLPAHLITGWAMKRAQAREPGKRWWHTAIRWSMRFLTIPIVIGYLFFVYLSQLTSWDGLATWIQQHAFLVPVPFVGV